MAHLNFHPAPGFGDLLPGFFVVPQNPIRGASTPLVPSVQAASMGTIVRVPHVGDLLPGQFPVPQNPIIAALATGMNGMRGMGCGCGGDCGCGCGGTSPSGIQGLSGISDSVAAWVTADSPVSGVSNFVFYGAAAAAVSYFLFFRHHRR